MTSSKNVSFDIGIFVWQLSAMTSMVISLDPGCCRDNFLLFGSRQGQLCWYIWAGIVRISFVISKAGGHTSSSSHHAHKCQAQFHHDADLYLVCEHFPWESWYRLPLLIYLPTYLHTYLLTFRITLYCSHNTYEVSISWSFERWWFLFQWSQLLFHFLYICWNVFTALHDLSCRACCLLSHRTDKEAEALVINCVYPDIGLITGTICFQMGRCCTSACQINLKQRRLQWTIYHLRYLNEGHMKK